MKFAKLRGLGLTLAVAMLVQGCGGASGAPPRSPAEQARQQGPVSTDPEVVGDWLIAEMLSLKGDATRAQNARKRLDGLGPGKGLHASIARALDEDAHGHPTRAAHAWMDVVRAARSSNEVLAPIAAWYAAERLLALRDGTSGVWETEHAAVESAIESPGSLGWRARADLVEWWGAESYNSAGKGVLERAAALHGCQQQVRIAGPFGRGVEADAERAFEAERPGSWPLYFSPEPLRPKFVPHVHMVERQYCDVFSSEPWPPGVYYGETFVEVQNSTEVLLAVQGARRVLVDDVPVLDRSPRQWGTWPRFGVHLRLEKGRHRIVARLESPKTSVRLLHPDGTPMPPISSESSGASYVTRPPVVVSDPNVLDRFIRGGDIVPTGDDLTTYLASGLAQVDGQSDVASVLLEPLVSSVQEAAPLALTLQGSLVQFDPIFPASDGRDLARELFGKVVAKDGEAWQARMWLATDGGDKKGLPTVARELKTLFDRFPEVPDIAGALSETYDQLGWQAEQSALVQEAARRFPHRARVLRALVDVFDSQGKTAEADQVVAKLQAIDADSDVQLDRALHRKQYKAAVQELKRLAARRPDRKGLLTQIEALLARVGAAGESLDQLEKLLAKNPRDAAARLALADARLARGDHGAVRRALADAIQAGAPSADLANAIELLEGRTELQPHRLDAKKVIEEFVKAGGEMEGNAVRVLDYSVLWVHPDGSARMLEHEIVRVQSEESIHKMAEQNVPNGLALRLRVIKKDGRILEPEFVAAKPTVTMPHLEVGDYIETETITSTPGDGIGGLVYRGPHWFFREQDIGYWRSEFVVISPKDRPLLLEAHGQIPEPSVSEDGMLVVRRWRVDKSPAAVIEPGTVPIQELLPSVRVGWGMSLERELRTMVDALSDRSIRDPRLKRIAERMVKGAAPGQREERARRIYHWILSNVEKGGERDPRKIIVGKSGEPSLAFIHLARLAGIPTEIVAVRDRLTEPPIGPMAEAESFNDFVIRIETERGEMFLTVIDKFAPFGYLPAELRGQPGYRLVEGTPKVTTSTTGSVDGIVYEGTVQMREDGAAEIDLLERFVGKYGIAVRRSLEALPKAQLHDAVESKLLASDLPGASLLKVDVQDQDDLDKPLTLHMKVVMADFARRQAGGLALAPPFRLRVAKLATLAERKTPMIIPDASHMEVRLRIKLPAKGTLQTQPAGSEVRDEDRVVIVRDRVEGKDLVIDRVFDIPAGRISVARYPALQGFARKADEATQREYRIGIR
jgi:cellulose synthase operon protein C